MLLNRNTYISYIAKHDHAHTSYFKSFIATQLTFQVMATKEIITLTIHVPKLVDW